MNNYSVAILVAAHNSEKFISCQLDSLLCQSYGNISITVSDDFSVDKTPDILKEYENKDSRIRLIKSGVPLKSAQANFMFLLKNAPDADFFMFCDHDDKWASNKVECTLNRMISGDFHRPRLVHSDLFVTDSDFNIISPSLFSMQKLPKKQTLNNALIQNAVTGCTAMINQPLRGLMLKKDSVENMIMHDWYLNILALAAGTVDFIDRPLIFYRQHGDNEVGAKDVRSAEYKIKKISDGKKNTSSVYDTFLQARDIAKIYETELGENFKTVSAYAAMAEMGKIKKVRTCIKYGFWKNTLLRKIGQIVYM